MESLVHSMETVWTHISGRFIVGSRLDFVHSYHTDVHNKSRIKVLGIFSTPRLGKKLALRTYESDG